MQNHLKYIIAHIAGSIVNDRQFSQIKSDQGYHKFSGSIQKDKIELRETDNNFSIRAYGSEGNFSEIEISETGDKFSLNIDAKQGEFSGSDYDSGSFSGSISGTNVTLSSSDGSSNFTLY